MRILLFAFLAICSFTAVGQDLLITRDGDTIKAIVIFVYYDNIQYRKPGDVAGTIISAPKYDLSKVIYANGQVDDFTKFMKPISGSDTTSIIVLDSAQIYHALGIKDAYKYYKGYKSAGTTSFIVSALGFGAFALLTTLNTPTDNLGFPDDNLKTNTDYYEAYIITAKKRKSRIVWNNVVFGSITGGGIAAAIVIIAR